ncbi:unnamed protein product [Penicillium salamii]|nr:unnamed protein product [Penicillium salamii]
MEEGFIYSKQGLGQTPISTHPLRHNPQKHPQKHPPNQPLILKISRFRLFLTFLWFIIV